MSLRTDRGRTTKAGIGAVALSGLVLSGCAVGDAAEFSDGTTIAADTSLKAVDADLLFVPAEADLGSITTTDPTTIGDASMIRMPSGLLELTSLATVASVSSSVISEASTPEEADTAAPDLQAPEEDTVPSSTAPSDEQLRAADGTVLKLVTFAYTSNESANGSGASPEDGPLSTEGIASPTLTLDFGGQSHTLPKPAEDGERTYLMSIPSTGETSFAVEQDGHEQLLDLRTGERIADDVASTYYREKTDLVTINEPLKIPEVTARTGGDGENEYDHTLAVKTHLGTGMLTPWTKDEGWAEPGTAWMILSGKSEFDTGLDQMMASTANVTYTSEPDAGDPVDFTVAFDDHGSTSFNETLPVPVDTQTVSITGSAKVDLKSDVQKVISENPVTTTSKQPYVIDFGPAPIQPESSTSEPDGTEPAPATESATSGN